MKQWEHKIVGVSTLGGMTNCETLLDRLGREGWEIVATTGRDGDRAVFKRRKRRKRRKRIKTKNHRELLEKVLPYIEPAGGHQTSSIAFRMQAIADEIKQALSD